MDKAYDCITAVFSEDGNKCTLELPPKFARYKHITLVSITYCVNFSNISASFGNNRLYLKSDGSVFTTLPDGLYDVEDLNSRNLQPAFGGRFYKIMTNINGQSWSIYSFTSAADRTSNTNPVLEDPSVALNGGVNLNKELYDGSFRPD